MRYIVGEATSIDYDAQKIHIKGRPQPLVYDVLSVNAGSTPSVDLESPMLSTPDGDPGEHLPAFAIAPVKPICTFSSKWDEIL